MTESKNVKIENFLKFANRADLIEKLKKYYKEDSEEKLNEWISLTVRSSKRTDTMGLSYDIDIENGNTIAHDLQATEILDALNEILAEGARCV